MLPICLVSLPPVRGVFDTAGSDQAWDYPTRIELTTSAPPQTERTTSWANCLW